jgi:hypothetical protein
VYNKHGKSATTLETCPESELSVNGIVIGDKVEVISTNLIKLMQGLIFFVRVTGRFCVEFD